MTLEAVTAALVTKFTTAVRTVDANALALDGPTPTEQEPPAYVIVGSTGDLDSEDTVDLQPSNLGPGTWDDETGEIQCVAYSWAGNGTNAQLRVIGEALVMACRASVKADPTLGGVLTGGYKAFVGTRITRTQMAGPRMRYGFTVGYTNLLTT